MTLSVLEQEYVPPTRPYSQNELINTRNRVFRYLRIGNVRAQHRKCGHFYFVKENGRKENEIKEKQCEDVGNCSVCWKMGKTPRSLKNTAKGLVESYNNYFFKPREYLNYDTVDVETVFYKWLYE